MDLWEAFIKSGKITDYLKYKSTSDKEHIYDNLESACGSRE